MKIKHSEETINYHNDLYYFVEVNFDLYYFYYFVFVIIDVCYCCFPKIFMLVENIFTANMKIKANFRNSLIQTKNEEEHNKGS